MGTVELIVEVRIADIRDRLPEFGRDVEYNDQIVAGIAG